MVFGINNMRNGIEIVRGKAEYYLSDNTTASRAILLSPRLISFESQLSQYIFQWAMYAVYYYIIYIYNI